MVELVTADKFKRYCGELRLRVACRPLGTANAEELGSRGAETEVGGEPSLGFQARQAGFSYSSEPARWQNLCERSSCSSSKHTTFEFDVRQRPSRAAITSESSWTPENTSAPITVDKKVPSADISSRSYTGDARILTKYRRQQSLQSFQAVLSAAAVTQAACPEGA